MLSTLIKTRVAGALIGAAIACTVGGAGLAAGQDLRTAGARDGAEQVPSVNNPDVRTPDAPDSGQAASPSYDRRTPDARDTPAPPLEAQPIADTQPAAGGFDVLSAAMGAAAGTGLLLVLAGFLTIEGLAGRRRHGSLRASATAVNDHTLKE